ncbi:hypothetical protein [Streptomyces peucetius]|uniref:Uncharacterized protein n=1 Tax=Streptomyces peucetius TaxID=1950 RepID=A0ABY6I4Q0_STRPE|nr:hypothetical protein [Streptomyces peucetius]UYQ60857.1 hypothetical protein OGH68_04815 [Streptomyces peucetius]
MAANTPNTSERAGEFASFGTVDEVLEHHGEQNIGDGLRSGPAGRRLD